MARARLAVRCPDCGSNEPLAWSTDAASCPCGYLAPIAERIVSYTPSASLRRIPEVAARDGHASAYLSHSKFPTQIARVREFLGTIPPGLRSHPVFELGCGPGPYTPLLVEQGFEVVAVDFSAASLSLNRDSVPAPARGKVTYLQANLTTLRMAPGSAGVLLMCDFLQHLGDRDVRTRFLAKALSWLRPGGVFYLTFFNLNLKNVVKLDRRGVFADGAIRYERLRSTDVVRSLPDGSIVDSVKALNIFRNPTADRIASLCPGASLAARMMAVAGRKA
jgi:SAM-dependent methyltransferase